VRIISLLADGLIFFGGLIAGMLLTIYGMSPLVSGEENHPIFSLPMIFYVAGSLFVIGMGLILRAIRRRIA